MKTEKSPNLAEIEISYRSKVKAEDRAKVNGSNTVYQLLKTIYNDATVDHHEEFVVLFLNRPLHILGWAKISKGGITSTVVDPRIIFQLALKANATGIIMSHNHPSGEIKPSEQDKMITKKITQGGELLEIQVLDHIIYTRENYYSFADEAEL